MAQNLSIGSMGPDVRDLQLSLNSRPPSDLPPLAPDGVFGPKTAARVKEFQDNNGLDADGIVGPKTRAALATPGATPDRGCNCCNGEAGVAAQAGAIADLFQAGSDGNQFALVSASAGGGGGAAAAAPSSPIRSLDATQQATAIGVYGASLDFSTIFISDKTGLGGRPFTLAIPNPLGGPTIQIINCGTFSPPNDTLIHELAHVWQSQHHSDKLRFMVNAVGSQAGAIVASTAAAVTDPFVMLNKDFPTFFPFDAYAYDPTTPFASLAAEQMAQAIENGESAIVTHVKGIAMNALDSACVTALSKDRFGDRRLPGVK